MKVKGRGITCLLVSFTVIYLVATPGGRACPRRCACYIPAEVHCTFRYLTSIPDSIPPNVERINLGYNSLVRLTETDFAGLTKLELLMLHSNGIHTLPDKTFSDLQALQKSIFDRDDSSGKSGKCDEKFYNKVRKLQKDTFYGLKSLTRLHMDHNNIEFINPEVFYGLNFLRLVHLEGNQLTKLHPDTFVSLSYLQIFKISFIKYLYLSDNFLTSLPQEMVSYMPDLESLYLHGNPWTCDCHLKWLSDWIQEKPALPTPDTQALFALKTLDNFLPHHKLFYLLMAAAALAWSPSFPFLLHSSQPASKLFSPCEKSGCFSSHPISIRITISPLGLFAYVIKCKKDRSPSSPQQCPLCVNPRTSNGKPLAMISAAAFQCTKPTIDSSLKSKSLTILEDSGSAFISPQGFMAPFGSLTMNMTDQSGNEANMVCSIQKPSRTSPIAFTEENDYIVLNTSFSTFLVCNIDYGHIQPVWQVLALYCDSPLILERSHLLSETPQLCYKYEQVAPKPEDIFTNIEADLRADPSWLMQDQISLQLNRTATTLSTLHIQYSGDIQITLPRAEMRPVKRKWTMIPRDNNTKLEHTVLVGGTIGLNCPGQGDPTPHLEWLLADGSKVRAPYVSEDGRILIDKSGKLELQMADSFDTGVYHCISTNYDDADILTYRITVVEPSVEAYLENGIHHTVFTGETLDLPCHSTGIPDASISWVLPGNNVLYQSSRDKKVLSNGTLRILQVTPKDQGYYRCVAANPSGVDFLIFQVSVKMNGQRPLEHGGETEGSGLDESNPIVPLKEPPRAQLPTSAPMGAEVGKQASSTSKRQNYRELIHQQHGESTHRRFRENRRHFPPSARRIDPQHWAALLEKVKKNAVPEKRENPTVSPPPLVTQLPNILEDDDSSGMLTQDEEFMVLATKALDLAASTVVADSRTVSPPVTNITSGTEFSPIVSSQILPPKELRDFKLPTVIETIAMSKNVNPIMSSQMQGTTNQHPSTVFPLHPGDTEFQHSDQMGRGRAHFQSAPPVTVRTTIKDVNAKMLTSTNDKVLLESVNTTNSHQTSVREVSEPRHNHFYSHTTQTLSTSTFPSDLHAAAHSQFQIPRNGTVNIPLFRRFGKWRRIGGRGQIISPYRTPILRRHRYSIFRPTTRGSSEKSTTTFSATALNVTCLSCLPRERLTTATAALSFPSTELITFPKVDIARVTSEESTTLVQNPLLLFENKPKVDIEKTTPTIKYFSTESSQVAPTGTVMTYAPTSIPMKKTHKINAGYPRVSSTNEAKRDSVSTSSLSGAITKPPMTTIITTTRFSRRKFPWQQNFVNNHNPKGRLKNQHKFSLQKSTAVILPKTSALPTDKDSPSHFTTLSASVMQIPSITLTTTSHTTSKTYSPESLPKMKELPFSSFNAVLPSIRSKDSSTVSISMQTAIPAIPPTVPASVITYETQTERPRAQTIQREKELLKKRNDPSISPGQSFGFTTSTAMTPPVLMTVETSIKPSVSAFTHSPTENTTGISSTIGHHSRTLNLTDVIEEPAQVSTWTLKSTIASETTLSGKSYQSTTTRKAIIRHSTMSPFLSSRAILMPIPISPPFTQRAVTDNVATPISRLMTNTVVKLQESLRHHANPQQLAEVATSPQDHPNAKFTTGTTHFIYSNLLHSTPMPALITVKSQNSKLTPSPWSENQFWHKPYSEIAEKEKTPEVSMLPTTGLPEVTTHASNWDGQKNAKSDFDKKSVQEVTTSKLLLSDSLSRNIFEKPRIVGGKAASFTIPANSDAFLPCEAVGNPLPTIQWTRVSSGLDLSKRKQNNRVQVLPNGTLSIQRVEIQDRGQYLCSASNLFGTDHLHVTLSVVSYPPRILERRTKEITVHSGSTVELKCRAEGRPSPTITWILANQTVVLESSQGSRQALVTGDGTLVIHNLSIYDRGFYKCVASNPAGQDSLLVKIQVIAAPPVILEQKRQVIVGTWGESLKLPCTAKGTPQPSIYWVLSDGTEVKPLQFTNSKLFLFSNGTLYIRNLASSDRGTYECIATSSTGSERRVVMLTMEERMTSPKIEAASQKRTEVNLGDKLLLNCSATGEPKPQIMWRLPSKAVVNQQHRLNPIFKNDYNL
ncbi:Immunoglobulin super member 10 [Saguinus oedipus]|nr:Immunoglobulin super member 10 [Saguinus oedipus]